jgi:arabinose-5-phosphate isomerase
MPSHAAPDPRAAAAHDAARRPEGTTPPDRSLARTVLQTEAAAILALVDRLDDRFSRAVELLRDCTGRVVVTGMGKSGIIARKVAATLASTGTPAFFLHPAEAIHGDLGVIQHGDVVVALSHSGETAEILRLLETIRRTGARIVALTGEPGSTLGQFADVTLDCHVDREACPLNLVPTASTTAALALGDALAMTLLVEKGFRAEDFASLHPGGKLGRRLMRVEQVMHAGDELPAVREATPMRDVIYEMSRKGLGMTCVVGEDGRLAGIITDGDLRRRMTTTPAILELRAADLMTRHPVTIGRHLLAVDALNLMEQRKITSVIVTDDGRAEGVVHLHDLWRTELI